MTSKILLGSSMISIDIASLSSLKEFPYVQTWVCSLLWHAEIYESHHFSHILLCVELLTVAVMHTHWHFSRAGLGRADLQSVQVLRMKVLPYPGIRHSEAGMAIHGWGLRCSKNIVCLFIQTRSKADRSRWFSETVMWLQICKLLRRFLSWLQPGFAKLRQTWLQNAMYKAFVLRTHWT